MFQLPNLFNYNVMKKFLCLVSLCFIFSVGSLFAQRHHNNRNHNLLPVNFRVGDNLYSSDYNGIKAYMFDLKDDQPDLYQKLTPYYKTIQNKRIARNAVMTSSIVLGGILLFANFPKGASGMTQAKSSASGMFVGVGVIGLGGILGFLLGPGEQDYLNFINMNNKYTDKDKMEIKIGLNYQTGYYPQIGLRFNF
jgi:hypothetical protein